MALTVVELLAIGTAHCQTGDRHRLASQGVSLLLEMEESALRRSPVCASGSSESDSANEPRQPSLGSSRIHGELLKIGIEVSQATVAKYMARQGKPLSQTWRTFLENHVQQIVARDFLVVRTVSFRLLFVFVVVGHHRRHAIHFNVTTHPTAEWTA